jgi:glycosyltransferase involved in cell wall biosynthesis
MINLFYPSSYLPHKNHHRLLSTPGLEGFLLANNISIYLTISPLPEYSFENIIYLGRVTHDDCLHRIQSADALLWCSEYESFGLPLFEAFAAETPIVAIHKPYVFDIFDDSVYYFINFHFLLHTLHLFIADHLSSRLKIPSILDTIYPIDKLVDLFLDIV